MNPFANVMQPYPGMQIDPMQLQAIFAGQQPQGMGIPAGVPPGVGMPPAAPAVPPAPVVAPPITPPGSQVMPGGRGQVAPPGGFRGIMMPRSDGVTNGSRGFRGRTVDREMER